MTIKLYLLGQPHIFQQGEVRHLKQRKGIALLAYLALSAVPRPREKLISLLWAESAGDAARKNLRNLLWAIRRELGPDVIIGESGESLQIAGSVWVDGLSFQAEIDAGDGPLSWEEPIALYRGELLEAFHIRDAPAFEQWVLAERERFQQKYLNTVRRLLSWYRTEGRQTDLIEKARRALSIDPLQEGIHRLLIEAYAAQGDRSDALQQFDLLRETLWEELGVTPVDETLRLIDQITAGRLTETLNSPLSSAQKSPSLLYHHHLEGKPFPFIGQQPALNQLDRTLHIVRSGRAHISLIQGEMGIGKSRLWLEWAGQQRSLSILSTSCLPPTQTIPFYPLISLMRSTPRLFPTATDSRPVPDIWLVELARLVPELLSAFPHLQPPQILSPEEDRLRLFEALTRLLTPPAGETLVLFIDDAHWTDQATLDWLGYYTHQLRDQSIMLVLSLRTEEMPQSVQTQIANWQRLGSVSEIRLPGLSEAEAHKLIHSVNPQAPMPDRIYQRGGGNPYFLIELSHSFVADIPHALRDLIHSRLSKLPDIERQVVETAMIVEPLIEFDILLGVSGRSEEELLAAVDNLIAKHILHEPQQRCEFVHPLLPEVIRSEMSVTRQRILHRRSAKTLQHHYADRLPEIASYLARHFALAEEAEAAGRYAEIAGDHALRVAALKEAADFYQQALAYGENPDRFQKLGRVYQLLGELDSARSAYWQAIEGYEQLQQPDLGLKISVDLGESYIQSGQPNLAQDTIHEVLGALDDKTPPEVIARAHLVLGSALLRNGSVLDAAQHQFEVAFDIASRQNLPNLAAYARFEEGNVVAQRGELGPAQALQEEAIEWAQRGNDVYMQVLATNNLAYYAVLSGRLTVGERAIQDGLALIEAHGLQLPLQYLYSTCGELYMARGAWDEAAHWFHRGIEEARLRSNLIQVANYEANLGLVARGKGAFKEALDQFETALDTLIPYGARHLRLQIHIWQAETLLLAGERQAAKSLLNQVKTELANTSRQYLHQQASALSDQLKQST
ncbi:MAG: BTAD domain-containing putative transcriptional regulator [Chloroflexota bacterium]